jgi:hypothetical protein
MTGVSASKFHFDRDRHIDRGIAASEKDYKEGRSYGPFKTHEGFIASLHKEARKLRKKKYTRSE